MERKRKFLACTCQNRGHFPFSRPFYTTTGLLQYLNRRPIQRRKQGENDGLTLLGVDVFPLLPGGVLPHFCPILAHFRCKSPHSCPILSHSGPFSWGKEGLPPTSSCRSWSVGSRNIVFFCPSRIGHDFPSGAACQAAPVYATHFCLARRGPNCQNSNGLPSPSCRRAPRGHHVLMVVVDTPGEG